MSSNGDLKVGIVGLRHSHVWGNLGTMLETAGATVVGISEEMEVLHSHAREAAPGVPLFSTMEDLLAAAQPDVVWAFVENNRHLEIAEVCVPLGIHLVFEKPLASTFADARAIRSMARTKGVQVLTNYQMAWWPTSHAALAAARAGEIGEVWRVRGVVGHGGPGGGKTMTGDPKTNRGAVFLEWLNDSEKNGGGALVDFGCYGAVWSLQYLGKPESVYAVTNVRKPDVYKVDDNAVILCRYERGAALLEGSWSLPRGFQDVEVFGDSGSLFATRQEAILTTGGRDSQARTLDAPPLPAERSSMIAYLADCISRGTEPEGMTALDINVDVVEIVEAARRSVASGAAVRLPLEEN